MTPTSVASGSSSKPAPPPPPLALPPALSTTLAVYCSLSDNLATAESSAVPPWKGDNEATAVSSAVPPSKEAPRSSSSLHSLSSDPSPSPMPNSTPSESSMCSIAGLGCSASSPPNAPWTRKSSLDSAAASAASRTFGDGTRFCRLAAPGVGAEEAEPRCPSSAPVPPPSAAVGTRPRLFLTVRHAESRNNERFVMGCRAHQNTQ